MHIEITKLYCFQCNRDWRPSKEEVFRCPYCKSPYFNSPEKRKTGRPKSKLHLRHSYYKGNCTVYYKEDGVIKKLRRYRVKDKKEISLNQHMKTNKLKEEYD